MEQSLLSGEPRWREQLVQGLEGPPSRHQSRGREMEKKERMIIGPERRLSAEELVLVNFGIGGLLRAHWTARRSNQSFLKEISPEYSLEGLMLKLKFQSFGHLMRRTDSLEKILTLGKIEGRRRG